MAKYLSNIKRVDIRRCDGIEEVISSRDDEENSTSASSYQDTTLFFPHLDTLHLGSLPCLESVDQSQSGQVTGVCWSLCQYPRKIRISECDALSSLIPWYALGQMKRLQELEIYECSRMTEVFNNNVDEGGAHGTSPTTLKNIIPQLSNLKKVDIFKCDLLSHLFTFSTLESLKQLEELKVKRCKAIQVIVKEENSTAGGINSSKDHVVVFPCLQTLQLVNLPNLKAFFLGMHIEFRWPLLDNVMINGCPELMMFTSGQSKAPKLNYIGTSLGRHSLECGINFNRTINEYQTTFPNSSSDPTISNGMPWSFHNLIQMKGRSDVGTAIVIPFNVLTQLQKLQQISIVGCHGVTEVFEVVALELEGSGFNESVKIPTLTQVKLHRLYDLKYLWKSNQWMVLEFPNLTTVDISVCSNLEHVFTCSMVGSLVQLQDLKIRRCSSIGVIVKEEEECDAKVINEIMLPRLKSLKLESLSSLKGFCLGKQEAFSLPVLDSLEVNYCPALTVFTKGQVATPELKVINAGKSGKWYLKTDLNSFIETKQQEGYEF